METGILQFCKKLGQEPIINGAYVLFIDVSKKLKYYKYYIMANISK